jgi:hypothetical protein
MSRKTVIFKRKVRQSAATRESVHALFPNSRVKGTGKKSQYIVTDGTDEDGNATRSVKRLPGVDTGLVCSQPMSDKKKEILTRLAPAKK